MYSATMTWENPLFPLASLLMKNCLQLEAFFKKKHRTQPESVGLCFSIAVAEREDETEMEGPLQPLALKTVKPHGRWPPLWIH